MRLHHVKRLLSFWAVPLLVTSCNSELPHEPSTLPPEPTKPLLNHAPQIGFVDANNYNLTFTMEHLASSYKGNRAIFAGGLSYGNATDAAFIYDPQGGFSPRFEAEIVQVVPGTQADHQTISMLIERPDDSTGPSNPLGLYVVRETFAFTAWPDDDYVILKYTLINPTGATVSGLHVGEILDIDLPYFDENVAEFVGGLDQYSRTTTSRFSWAHGHILLSHPVNSFRSWITGTDPLDLSGFYGFLSGGIPFPGPIGPADVRQLMTAGPLDVPAGGALVVFTALVGGDDTADLGVNIGAARAKYAGLPAASKAAVVVAAVQLQPGRVRKDKDLYSAEFTFVDAPTAALFDATTTFCGGAQAVQFDLEGGNVVTAKFPKEEIDLRLKDDGEISCGGLLTDGRFFADRVAARFKNQFIATVTQLTSVHQNYGPTWSPDGTSIAYVSQPSGGVAKIWKMDAASGEASAVQLTPGGTVYNSERYPDWSPDGSTIAFTRDGGIFTVPAAGVGAETQLTSFYWTGSGRFDHEPRWSPNGSEIAFRSAWHVWKMDATGELGGGSVAEISSGGDWRDLSPDWATDGLVYFHTWRNGLWSIFSVDPLNPEPPTLAVRVTPIEDSENLFPSVSTDASTLAFLSRTTAGREIILQDLATGKHTVVLFDTPVILNMNYQQQHVELSPDGNQVAFVGFVENPPGTFLSQVFVADISGLR
jgi:hypothetical protein